MDRDGLADDAVTHAYAINDYIITADAQQNIQFYDNTDLQLQRRVRMARLSYCRKNLLPVMIP